MLWCEILSIVKNMTLLAFPCQLDVAFNSSNAKDCQVQQKKLIDVTTTWVFESVIIVKINGTSLGI